MAFRCSQCGECCSHMGTVHRIAADLGEMRFLVHNEYTGEETVVEVDSDKHALFADRSIFADLPETCFFFRRHPSDGKAYCTVHLTRPEICRDFGCWRLLIETRSGERAGRVMFRRYLSTGDPLLQKIWDEHIGTLSESDDERWEAAMIPILVGAGYRVIK